MGDRPRHQKPEGEELLRNAEAHGCVVTKGRKYFMVKCGCGDDRTTVHLTPHRNHFKSKLRLMEKWACWNQEELS